MRVSGKFCQRVSKFDNFFFFFFDGGIEDPNTAINGPPSTHQQNAIEMASNIECWLGSFVIFQGIWTSIAKKPYIFVILQGRGWSGPPPPPLDPPMHDIDCSFIFTIVSSVGHLLRWVSTCSNKLRIGCSKNLSITTIVNFYIHQEL